MIRLPEIKTVELSTYGNFAKCHQAHFRVPRVGLGMRLYANMEGGGGGGRPGRSDHVCGVLEVIRAGVGLGLPPPPPH